jgi:hypothetical protein
MLGPRRRRGDQVEIVPLQKCLSGLLALLLLVPGGQLRFHHLQEAPAFLRVRIEPVLLGVHGVAVVVAIGGEILEDLALFGAFLVGAAVDAGVGQVHQEGDGLTVNALLKGQLHDDGVGKHAHLLGIEADQLTEDIGGSGLHAQRSIPIFLRERGEIGVS